jgi:hypothetical protein
LPLPAPFAPYQHRHGDVHPVGSSTFCLDFAIARERGFTLSHEFLPKPRSNSRSAVLVKAA